MKILITLATLLFIPGLTISIHSMRIWKDHGYDYWIGDGETGPAAVVGWIAGLALMGLSAIALLCGIVARFRRKNTSSDRHSHSN